MASSEGSRSGRSQTVFALGVEHVVARLQEFVVRVQWGLPYAIPVDLIPHDPRYVASFGHDYLSVASATLDCTCELQDLILHTTVCRRIA